MEFGEDFKKGLIMLIFMALLISSNLIYSNSFSDEEIAQQK